MRNSIFFLILACGFAMSSCKKKPSAGLGGNANMKITAKHHSLQIDSCRIYIKFNSSEAPSSLQDYDINQAVHSDSTGLSFTIFTGLKKGDYYIYGEGWDPTIAEKVKGGIPYSIKQEIDFDLTLPVTED